MRDPMAQDTESPPASRPHEDDEALVAACLNNDEAAWRRLFTDYRPMCRIIARKYISGDDLDELFSDFVLRLLDTPDGKAGALRRYNGQVKLKTYLSVVFTRMLIDKHRARQHSHVVEATEEVLDTHMSKAPQKEYTSEVLDCPGIDEALAEAIAALPDFERKILELYHFHRLKLRQIAELTNCSISKISRSLDAIYDRLRDPLAAFVDENCSPP